MRLQPPKDWPHESMTEDMFDQYIKEHVVIPDSESGKIKLLEFYEYMIKTGKDRFEVAMRMSTFFPTSHQIDFLRSLLRITS